MLKGQLLTRPQVHRAKAVQICLSYVTFALKEILCNFITVRSQTGRIFQEINDFSVSFHSPFNTPFHSDISVDYNDIVLTITAK